MRAKPSVLSSGDRPKDVDLVSRWSVVVLLITGLLTGAYWLIHYAARLDETRAHMTALPDNYRDTVRVLLGSSGSPCREVCDMAPIAAASGKAAFKVSCSTDTADRCSTTRDYTLTIEPVPVPSR
jgi:hypothetical protein